MKREYKPLLYTTTLRNPERCKYFLHLLKNFDGRTLTDSLIREIECEFFKCGLYRPVNVPPSVVAKWKGTKPGQLSETPLTDEEANIIHDLNDPIQNAQIKGHKEKGFGKGWQSRFDTQFKMMKTLGFVWYAMGDPIEISPTGTLLAQSVKIDMSGDFVESEVLKPANEQSAFLIAFSKQQRNNPFIRERNDNIPLILLLETIQKLNSESASRSCGIAYRELPLLLCWKDNDAFALHESIMKLRTKYGYSYSDDVIWNACIYDTLGGYKEFKLKSLVQEYPDEFVRKMRMTGLVSFRGGGRFIDVNRLEDKTIQYIIEKYSHYKKYATEREYYDYMSREDSNLLKNDDYEQYKNDASQKLARLAEEYPWDVIRSELKILEKKALSKHDVLKYLPAPVRLEFLTALAIKSRFPHVVVSPHYRCDDEGLPVSTAPGGCGDLECYEYPNGVLVEVTMSEGRTQTITEIWPIARHLADLASNSELVDTECIFIAPSIFIDSKRQIDFLRHSEGKRITPYKITDFTKFLENSDKLFTG